MDAGKRAEIMNNLTVDPDNLASVGGSIVIVSGVIRDIYEEIKKITKFVVDQDTWKDEASERFRKLSEDRDKIFELHVQQAEGLGPEFNKSAKDYQDVSDSASSSIYL